MLFSVWDPVSRYEPFHSTRDVLHTMPSVRPLPPLVPHVSAPRVFLFLAKRAKDFLNYPLFPQVTAVFLDLFPLPLPCFLAPLDAFWGREHL